MKKLITIFCIFVSQLASATVTINWSMPNENDEVFLPGASPLPDNSLWQLIWSSSNSVPQVINPFEPFTPTGGEVLLDEGRNNGGGFIFNLGGTYSGTDYSRPVDAFVGGYTYTRVFDFQGDSNSFAVVDISDMLYEESGFSNQLTDTSTAQSFPVDHYPFVNEGVTFLSQVNVIPEPTTLITLLVGIVGLLGFRRHLQKK